MDIERQLENEYHPGIDLARKAPTVFNIVGMDRAPDAARGVVGDGDGILLQLAVKNRATAPRARLTIITLPDDRCGAASRTN
jgi:hypothetical protein